MQNHEIEALARDAIQRAKSGSPVEDSRVEFKLEFIEPSKAARRLAAHANASAYEPIVWIIGVKEDGTVGGVTQSDFASWFAQVAGWFDGFPPRPKDVVFPLDGKMVLAIAFETDSPPYVVTNPKGGGIDSEVPWRTATRVRTANRAELLQILVPHARVPKVEILSAEFFVTRDQKANEATKQCKASARFDLYFAQPTLEPVALPLHKITMNVEVGDGRAPIVLENYRFSERFAIGAFLSSFRQQSQRLDVQVHNKMIEVTSDEAIVRGFGKLSLHARSVGSWAPEAFPDTCILKAALGIAGEQKAITLTCKVKRSRASKEGDFSWVYQESLADKS